MTKKKRCKQYTNKERKLLQLIEDFYWTDSRKVHQNAEKLWLKLFPRGKEKK